jgi:hypothetical protein
MSSLRKEYKQYQEKKNEIVSEAAISWVEENFVLINEKLNRKDVSRLIQSITKFEEKFGEFSDRLPAIRNILDQAQTGLQLVVTGKASDSRASDLLKELSVLYNLLSSFFGQDLPVLLKMHMFSDAKANPTVRLDSLTGPFDTKSVLAAFENALRPSKDEMTMYKRIYKKGKLPMVDAKVIAVDLLALSFADLQQLSGVEKTPMVVTQDEVDGVVGEQSIKLDPEKTRLKIGEGKKKSLNVEGVLLTEALNPQRLNKIIELTAKINETLGKNKEFLPNVSKSLNNLISMIRKSLASEGGVAQALASLVDKDDLSVKVKQLELFYNTFKQIQGSWEQIKPLFQDGELTSQELGQIQALLNKSVSGNFLNKITNLFKVKPFAGLEPNKIVTDLIQTITNIQQKSQTPEQKTQTFALLDGVLSTKLPDLSSFTQNSKETQATNQTNPNVPTQGTNTSTGTGAPTKPSADVASVANKTKATANDGSLSDIEKKIAQQLADPKNMQAVLNVLQKAGYKLTQA